MLETKHIEYKQKATPELEKEVVAFLNSEGGAIYIGIDKEGHTVGVTSPDTLQLELKDRFKNNIVPSCMGLFDILAEKREGKMLSKLLCLWAMSDLTTLRNMGFRKRGLSYA